MTDAMVIVGGATLILFLIGIVWQMLSGKIAALDAKLTITATDLGTYKLKIAEEYVSRETLREMEERIMQAIKAVSETQGKIFEELKSKADK